MSDDTCIPISSYAEMIDNLVAEQDFVRRIDRGRELKRVLFRDLLSMLDDNKEQD